MAQFGGTPRWGKYVPKLPPAALGKKGPRSRLNRRQSPMRVRWTPTITVLLASLLPMILPVVAQMPILPPFGFMAFLAWRLLRPGIWPLWAGFPFGLFDDLCSGQPMGSGALLWSMVILVLELWEQRQAGRDYIMDWMIALVAIALVIWGGAWMVGLSQPRPPLHAFIPQIVIALLVFPFIMRLIAGVDRWRLAS